MEVIRPLLCLNQIFQAIGFICVSLSAPQRPAACYSFGSPALNKSDSILLVKADALVHNIHAVWALYKAFSSDPKIDRKTRTYSRGKTMQQILVDAYDPRHPDHEVMMNLECDKGLDIALHPRFEVTILVPDACDPTPCSRH
jgi:hypothetical protein